MSERLQTWLRGERVLPEEELQAALARQTLYGGALDTAILERGAMTETAIWARLAAATGLSAPAPALCDPSRLTMPPALDADVTGPLRTVPVAGDEGTIDLLCAEPFEEANIRATALKLGFRVRLYVIPETRLFAMRQRLYGEPLPPRYVPLLARAIGATQARTAYAAPAGAKNGIRPEIALLEHAATQVAPQPASPPPPLSSGSLSSSPPRLRSPQPNARGPAATAARTPTTSAATGENAPATPLEHVLDLSGPLSTASDPAGDLAGNLAGNLAGDLAGDVATEALCRRARDPSDRGRVLALRALRRRLAHPATQALLGEWKAVLHASGGGGANEPGLIDAIEALAEVRDGSVVRSLIERLHADAGSRKVAAAARRALVALAAQDFGMSQRSWGTWAAGHANRHRVEWLLEGLAHKRPEIRMAVAEELRSMADESFGYAFNGPRREREAGQRRFAAWWRGISPPERLIPE